MRMSGLHQNKNTDISWEPEEDVGLPPHLESIRAHQMVLQRTISGHLLVDRDKDWSDIELKDLRRVLNNKQQINEDGQVNRKKESLSELLKEKISINQKSISALLLKRIFKFIDYGIRLLTVVIKFLSIFLLHFLDIKKIRRTRRRKKESFTKNKKQIQKSTTKKSLARKNISMSKSTPNINLKWKEANTPFIPSSNLYCYWCTKKLGLKSWELGGHFYCEACRLSKS